jgi:indole-3-glycerol phosphate synthase
MGFLDSIVPAVRRSIESTEYVRGVPLRGPETVPSFRKAIERDDRRRALLVEYKRVSPGRDDPVLPARSTHEFLAATSHAPVAGYSCLATVPEFRGSPADVAEIARATRSPVLFKEFVIDRRQVEVAARSGASAVLLIARLPGSGRPVEPLSSLAEAAHALGLEVLLEFHERAELSRQSDVAADVYGVNARNLDTLAIDRRTAMETLREADRRGLRPLLGLSGVETPLDARAYWDAGVDGILVGSAVARAPDPAAFLSSLRDIPGGEAR